MNAFESIWIVFNSHALHAGWTECGRVDIYHWIFRKLIKLCWWLAIGNNSNCDYNHSNWNWVKNWFGIDFISSTFQLEADEVHNAGNGQNCRNVDTFSMHFCPFKYIVAYNLQWFLLLFGLKFWSKAQTIWSLWKKKKK